MHSEKKNWETQWGNYNQNVKPKCSVDMVGLLEAKKT